MSKPEPRSTETDARLSPISHNLMAALAEFERDVIRERTLAGLDAARARGRTGGRCKATETMRPEQLARAKGLYATRPKDGGEKRWIQGPVRLAAGKDHASVNRATRKVTPAVAFFLYPAFGWNRNKTG